MNKYMELLKCDLKIFIREPMGAGFIIFFPIIMLFINFIVDSNGKYFQEMIAGTSGLAIMSSTIMGVAIVIGINRETNIYRRYAISNIKKNMIFTSMFIVQVILNTCAIILQFLVAILFYGFERFCYMDIGYFIIDCLIATILLFSIGILLSSIIKSFKNLHGITSLFFTIMMILSGSAFPISKMPFFIQKIVMILPLSQVNLALIQDLMGNNINHIIFYIYSVVVSLLCLVIGIKNFQWEAV